MNTCLAGADHNLVRSLTRRNNHRARGPHIKRFNQAALNIGYGVAVLNPVGRLRCVNRHRVNIAGLNRARQFNYIGLMCLVIASDNCYVIAVAEADRLNIGYRDVVVTGS